MLTSVEAPSMSITYEDQIRCACGMTVRVVVAESVNAARHPHLRQALLDGQLHRYRCAGCGAELVVEKKLLYFDPQRRQFFVHLPRPEMAREAESIAVVRQLYDASFGAGTAALLQEVGREMMVRLCFGLSALREKVLADEAGLNDLALEAVKCEVLGHVPELEHRGAAGLWLVQAGATELRFAAETDGAPLPVVVPRATYEAVAALGAEEIQRWRPGLARGPHVSMQRLGLVDG